MRILGIDPGTETTGWGVIDREQGGRIKVQDYGVIKTSSKSPFPKRLIGIYRDLTKVIEKFKPEVMAVEELFFARNLKTAVSVGQARGVALLAGAQAGLEIREYTPLEVKMALVGYGRAEKVQVQKMVKAVLGLKELPKPDDAADALAIAVCQAHSSAYSRIVKENVCLPTR